MWCVIKYLSQFYEFTNRTRYNKIYRIGDKAPKFPNSFSDQRQNLERQNQSNFLISSALALECHAQLCLDSGPLIQYRRWKALHHIQVQKKKRCQHHRIQIIFLNFKIIIRLVWDWVLGSWVGVRQQPHHPGLWVTVSGFSRPSSVYLYFFDR